MIILDMEKANSCAECELRFCGICEQGYDKEPCPIKAEIPDGVTNGDVIKAMFPSDVKELDMSKSHLMYDGLDYIKEFRKDWWDTPYGGIRNE